MLSAARTLLVITAEAGSRTRGLRSSPARSSTHSITSRVLGSPAGQVGAHRLRRGQIFRIAVGCGCGIGKRHYRRQRGRDVNGVDLVALKASVEIECAAGARGGDNRNVRPSVVGTSLRARGAAGLVCSRAEAGQGHDVAAAALNRDSGHGGVAAGSGARAARTGIRRDSAARIGVGSRTGAFFSRSRSRAGEAAAGSVAVTDSSRRHRRRRGRACHLRPETSPVRRCRRFPACRLSIRVGWKPPLRKRFRRRCCWAEPQPRLRRALRRIRCHGFRGPGPVIEPPAANRWEAVAPRRVPEPIPPAIERCAEPAPNCTVGGTTAALPKPLTARRSADGAAHLDRRRNNLFLELFGAEAGSHGRDLAGDGGSGRHHGRCRQGQARIQIPHLLWCGDWRSNYLNGLRSGQAKCGTLRAAGRRHWAEPRRG